MADTINQAIAEITSKIYDNTSEEISGLDNQQVLVMLANMFKTPNLYEIDPATVSNPPSQTTFMGWWNGDLWIKQSDGTVSLFHSSTGTGLSKEEHDFDFSAPPPYTYQHNKGRDILNATYKDSTGWTQPLMIKNIDDKTVQVSDPGTGQVEAVTLLF